LKGSSPIFVTKSEVRSGKADAQEIWACGTLWIIQTAEIPLWWIHVSSQVHLLWCLFSIL